MSNATVKAPNRLFPRASVDGADEPHTWSPPSKSFEVRSKTYLNDKVKEDSGPSLLVLVDADVFVLANGKHNEKIDRMNARSDSYVRYLREECKDSRRVVVITFQMHPRYLVLTFVENDRQANNKIEAGQLLNRFFTSDADGGWSDEYCAQRLKLIPRIENFSVPGVNLNRPIIIANKITTQFFREKDLIEVNIDVFSSRVARFIVGYMEAASTKLVIEMAFTLEGSTAEELPGRR